MQEQHRWGRRARAWLWWLVIAGSLVSVLYVLTRPALTPEGAPVEDPLPADLRAFVDERPVRVGWFRGAPPISIWDGDSAVGGYGIEQWNLAAIKLGFAVEHVAFDEITAVVEALRDGSIDVAGGHGEREDLRTFARPMQPTAWERITFVGAPGQASASADSLAGRTATTVADSPLVLAMRLRYPELDYVPTASIAEGLVETARGDIDLYMGPLGIAGYTMRERGLDLVPIGEDLEIVTISAWAPPGSPAADLARVGRAALSDDEISLITVRWAGFDLGRPGRNTPTWLPRALSLALALALVLGLFSLVLRRRVTRATSELTQVNRELETLNLELEGRVRERTSELAAAVQRLNESNVALSEFARSVAHDLRGPVTAIYGMSALWSTIDVPEHRDAMLATIEASSSRMAGMIEQLLEGAVRAGARAPGLDGDEFAGWLPDIVGAERHVSGATLNVEVPSGNLPVDAYVVRRAAINLVGNALKYAANPAGTRVDVSLARTDDDTWTLTVDDNGPGVPEPMWDRVFEPGYRGDRDDRGLGQGLADTRDIVVRAGGAVSVGRSDLGGARFTVTLPAREPSTVPTVGNPVTVDA